MSAVLDNIKTRRSVRSYENRQLSAEQLQTILTAALYAPSANNTQCWQFTVVQGDEKLAQLQHAMQIALGEPNYHRFYNAPTLIITSTPRDYKNAYPDTSVALQNIFLAAHDIGISSVWINQLIGNCDVPEVRAVLTEFGIPENHAAWGCAALGFAKMPPAPGRENHGVIHFA